MISELNALMLNSAAIPDDFDVFYTMDSITGTTLEDETGTFDGTINGATQVAGYIGSALDFDGVNDRVTGNFGTTSSPYTYSLWFKIAATPAGAEYFVGQRENAGLGVTQRGFIVGPSQVSFFSRDAGDVFYQAGSGTTDDFDNEWHHALGIQDGVELELWIDGVQKATTTMPSENTNFVTQCYLGCDTNISAFLDGQMDLFRKYSRRLTPLEIAALARERG